MDTNSIGGKSGFSGTTTSRIQTIVRLLRHSRTTDMNRRTSATTASLLLK